MNIKDQLSKVEILLESRKPVRWGAYVLLVQDGRFDLVSWYAGRHRRHVISVLSSVDINNGMRVSKSFAIRAKIARLRKDGFL